MIRKGLVLICFAAFGLAACLEARGQAPTAAETQPPKKFVFQVRGRRDPFKPPRAATQPVKPVVPVVRTGYTVQEEEQYLKLAEQLWEQLKAFREAGQHRDVVIFFSRLTEIVPERFPSQDKRQRIRHIQEQAARAANESRAIVLAKEGEPIIESMERLLEEDKYDTLAKLDAKLQGLIAELRFEDPVVKALVEDLSNRAAQIVERAKIRQECRSLVYISAIAWSADSPAAIINEYVAQVGDLVKGDVQDANIWVKSIQENSVTFSYKGEEITKPLAALKAEK